MYLTNGIAKARNISEITCTRLKNITSGTRGLKFHATIPISIDGKKIGLINLVSKETQQLTERELSMLNTISELISIAIQRTRIQESGVKTPFQKNAPVVDVLSRVIEPGMKELVNSLQQAQFFTEQGNSARAARGLQNSLQQANELYQQLLLIQGETAEQETEEKKETRFHYPTSPLSGREMEVLLLVKKGLTNKQIATQLYISERTVKFHISSILSKLLARTRTEAVETAIQRGLLGV
jgi:DNA-binding CsgD family transcriptional regulator